MTTETLPETFDDLKAWCVQGIATFKRPEWMCSDMQIKKYETWDTPISLQIADEERQKVRLWNDAIAVCAEELRACESKAEVRRLRSVWRERSHAAKKRNICVLSGAYDRACRRTYCLENFKHEP